MLAEIVATGGGDAAAIAAAKGFEAMDDSVLAAMIDQAIADNAAAWASSARRGQGDGRARRRGDEGSKGQADGKPSPPCSTPARLNGRSSEGGVGRLRVTVSRRSAGRARRELRRGCAAPSGPSRGDPRGPPRCEVSCSRRVTPIDRSARCAGALTPFGKSLAAGSTRVG